MASYRDQASYDLPVPTYTEHDDAGLFARIEDTPGLTLPILHAPNTRLTPYDESMSQAEYDAAKDLYVLQTDIVNAFFAAVRNKRDEVVVDFISRGLVSPDVTDEYGRTPILAVVCAGNIAMLRRLISLGALVDGYGRSLTAVGGSFPFRTALQVAASRGNLAMVRVLMEEHSANDALIAPDGALALRLAAANSHEEIVRYLPTRRGGAWLRWKTAHQAEMKVVRRALTDVARFCYIIVWGIPYFVFWILPVYCVVIPVWKEWKHLGRWVRRAGNAVWSTLKQLPRDLTESIVRKLKAFPGAIETVYDWIISGFKRAGKAAAEALKQVALVLHTTATAIITWFKDLKVKDIWYGLYLALRSIFVGFPLALWAFVGDFGGVSYKVLGAVFGTLGKVGWCIVSGLGWLAVYVPRELWTIVRAMGRIVGRGFDECLVWFDPKRV